MITAPHILLGQQLNDIITGSKNGELETLGKTVTQQEPEVAQFKEMVVKNGLPDAKRLLGKAILTYGEKNYGYVFSIAKAVLTGICSGGMVGANADAGALAAIKILHTLSTDAEVPLALRQEVVDRVLFACRKELYSNYQTDLMPVLTDPRLETALQQFITQTFTDFLTRADYSYTWALDPRNRYNQKMNKEN